MTTVDDRVHYEVVVGDAARLVALHDVVRGLLHPAVAMGPGERVRRIREEYAAYDAAAGGECRG